MTTIPVCKGTLTGARFMIGAVGRSMGKRWLEATGPLPSSGSPKATMTRPIVHPPQARPSRGPCLDFIARVQMLAIAEQHDANFVRIDVERDSIKVARELHQFIEAHARKA